MSGDSVNLLQVEILHPYGVFKSYKTYDKEILLGRDKNCHIVINDNNISRAHLKISWSGEEITINDLGSSNGTFINKHKISPGYIYKIFQTDEVVLGASPYKLKATILTTNQEKALVKPGHEIKKEPLPLTPDQVVKENNEIEGVVKFLKIDEKLVQNDQGMELDFKNVGLNLPKYNTPTDHANEIIREAEYLKASMIKGAEIKKEKIIDQAKIESLKLINDNYEDYRLKIQGLLEQTKSEIARLKHEAEMLNKEKEQQTFEEINRSWEAHREQLKLDTETALKRLEKDHAMKSELLMEKLQLDMMVEKNKIISEAEYEILKKKRAQEDQLFEERKKHSELLADQAQQQVEQLFREKKKHDDAIEKEKREHEEKIRIELHEHNTLITNLKQQIENLNTEHMELVGFVKNKNLEKTLLLEDMNKFSIEHSDAESKLKNIKEELKAHEDEYIKVKDQLENFATHKTDLESSIQKLNLEFDALQESFKSLTEKNRSLKEEYEGLQISFETMKRDKKQEIDNEITQYRKFETAKFEEFKVSQAQSYQKLKNEHLESIKKISIDLSQEVSTKLELLSKQTAVFNFEKTLEVVNSVIQIKTSQLNGGSAQHEEQLKIWKQRQEKEKYRIYTQTFAAYVVITVIGYFLYTRLAIDPVERQRRALAAQREEQITKNKFVAQKDSTYRESYVDLTIYTSNFTEKYLDEKLQDEFIRMATKKFLSRWKVSEEITIKVNAASRAFVQAVDEKSQNLTKDRFRNDIEKLKIQEQEMIKEHEELFGSAVRYQDYKKMEQEFFSKYLK